MVYDIQSQSDFLTGISLTIKIPENELDKKALYTIQADRPRFILPFHYRSIDGQIEFVYQIGAQSKLLYLSGSRTQNEYTSLWSGLLTPLLNCGDWFMKPYSFVLSVEHLYYDRNENTVCYIYIPTIGDCSQQAAVREMAAEFSKHISVADSDLENLVLRAIMRDFNPKDLLQMLEQYSNVSNTSMALWSAPKQETAFAPVQVEAEQPVISYPDIKDTQPLENKPISSGDIFISIPAKGKSSSKAKGILVDWRDTNNKKEKEQKKQKSPRGLFSGRKEAQQDISIDAPHKQPGHKREPAYTAQPDNAQAADILDVTQSISATVSGTRFRLTGSASLPAEIDVKISEGEIFTIGRYDAAAGRQQSSFEFDKKTKAVSRRHAAIERDSEKYSIIDLSSSAGTYINGQKLPPNTPCALGSGCRVSFGNAGADYVWEE